MDAKPKASEIKKYLIWRKINQLKSEGHSISRIKKLTSLEVQQPVSAILVLLAHGGNLCRKHGLQVIGQCLEAVQVTFNNSDTTLNFANISQWGGMAPRRGRVWR